MAEEKLKKFPVIYKTAQTGKQVMWSIKLSYSNGGVQIDISRGYVNGKVINETPLIITAGKASRSVVEQANLVATSKYNKKINEGYSVDSSNSPGTPGSSKCPKVYPFLLKDFKKDYDKINYPASAQPKFDGIRAISGKLKCGEPISLKNLTFTSRKAITLSNQMDHIREEMISSGFIENLEKGRGDVFVDGELFTSELSFEEISGLSRKKYLGEDDYENTKKIVYNIFDVFYPGNPGMIYSERREILEKAFNSAKAEFSYITLVPEVMVKSKDDVEKKLDQFIKKGYEGIVIRNLDFVYKGARISDVQKYKRFEDAEFKIVGAEKGVGKAEDSIIFILETEDHKEFKATYNGTIAEREKLYSIRSKLIGKMATVKYQELTAMGVPRFGTVKTIRDLGEFL